MTTPHGSVDFASIERVSREVGLTRYKVLKLVARCGIRTLEANRQLLVHLPDVRKALETARQQGAPVCAGDYHRRG